MYYYTIFAFSVVLLVVGAIFVFRSKNNKHENEIDLKFNWLFTMGTIGKIHGIVLIMIIGLFGNNIFWGLLILYALLRVAGKYFSKTYTLDDLETGSKKLLGGGLLYFLGNMGIIFALADLKLRMSH